MKAAVYERYGLPDVVRITDVEKPVPRDDEVLIRIRATTVTSADSRVRSFTMPAGFGPFARLMFGITRPRQPILGTELAGEIEAIGRAVTRFKVGDRVFATSGVAMGCHAEYRCLPEDGTVAFKPPDLTWEEAAALSFGGTTALHFLRRGRLGRGEKVLVNGASGCVGTAVVQLARYFGAEVTGVCSAANAELVRSLGATHVIDYTKEDFTRNGETYDMIVDTAGTAPFSRCRHSLATGGRLLMVLAGLPAMLQMPWAAMSGGKRLIVGTAEERVADLVFLAELARTGRYRPVIDRCYPFERIVEAHRYVDTGRKRGSVAITLQ
ncbi:MAG TPA: NAD(P)-dependent alcohol dehydrogenase [Gammaproteobacteria bacterium]|nr:NAD(P)-dependent alcohol dehydrogenase [Gammaproteobacteria bacterium]